MEKEKANDIYKDFMAQLGELYTQKEQLDKQIATIHNQLTLLNALVSTSKKEE